MQCVLLGGAGFIGSHVAQRLLDAGHHVRVFDRPGRAAPRAFPGAERIEWQEGDFLNRRDVALALGGCDAVFHLVSTTLPGTADKDPVYDVQTNVVGTLHMLDEALAARVAKVVFVSSGGTVYGVPREIPIAETHPTEPITAYGIGKLTIEKYLGLYRALHGLDYRVLRLANPFGERQNVASGQGAVSTFLHRAHRGEPIEIWGNGTVVRDYVYVGDVADAFVRALSYEGEHRIINIGSGVGHDLNEIVAAIERVTGRPLRPRFLPGRSFDVPANVLDVRLARRELGWQPATDLETGLLRTLQWLRNA